MSMQCPQWLRGFHIMVRMRSQHVRCWHASNQSVRDVSITGLTMCSSCLAHAVSSSVQSHCRPIMIDVRLQQSRCFLKWIHCVV